jgi:soluble lytic murein transglycosylase
MLYLKNSLVNLTIIFFSLFFLTVASTDDGSFIFPKKKIITIKINEKKLNNPEISKNFTSITMPRKNPLRENSTQQIKLKDNEKISELVKKKSVAKDTATNGLPEKKTISQNEAKTQNSVKPFLENITQNKINQIKEKTNSKVSRKIIKTNNTFLYPSKKPLIYSKVSTKTLAKSKILKEKDYTLAKNIFNLIKKGKWNTAVSETKKVKDKNFKKLVTWLYLKQSGNQATFSDYKNFIEKNSNYPRIGRLRYMAEHKIILENTSPKTIINWFDGNEPLSGTGKIKLGEAYLKIGKVELGTKLIKSGWTKADLSKRDVRYYRKKYKKILITQDHLKRADYLAWDNQYWDLKRMLPYLPKKEKLLYNARFILMTN